MNKQHMNNTQRDLVRSIVFAVALLLMTAVSASADLVIVEVQTVDVTPSGFSVIWKASDSATPQTGVTATPGIAVFSDAAGTAEITSELEITALPLYGGNPGTVDAYEREEGIEELRTLAENAGLMKIGVHGCVPRTTYYFQITSEDTSGNVARWPEAGLLAVTTMDANAFVADSRQILVSLFDDTGPLDSQPSLLTASCNETLNPVSSYAGDGAAGNQAYLNLSNLFDADRINWTPTGLKIVTLEIRMPGNEPVQRNLAVFFSDIFHVSAVSNVEINMDEPADITAPLVQPSPAGGQYDTPQTVILSADEPAYIFYTTDGSDPTLTSDLYTDPIQVDATATIKFLAVDMSGNQSDPQSALYTIISNQPPEIPSSPVPGDGDTAVSVRTVLQWQDSDPDPADSLTYDVYLGTSDTHMAGICEARTVPSCVPEGLEFNTTYYRQVMAKDAHGVETAGPVWHFTTFAYDGDADGDGLNNGDEIAAGTDPFNWDTDRDGYGDGEEVGVGTDPLNRNVRPPYSPGFGDLDGDGDIDAMDLALFSSAMGSGEGEAAYLPTADFNNDGVVDKADLDLFCRVFGYTFHPAYDPSADFDQDGDVDAADLSMLVSAFGSQEADPASAYDATIDLNGDGQIDRWDLALFSMAYGFPAD